jgi:hypothetical protein
VNSCGKNTVDQINLKRRKWKVPIHEMRKTGRNTPQGKEQIIRRNKIGRFKRVKLKVDLSENLKILLPVLPGLHVLRGRAGARVDSCLKLITR